jgi:hypothetical protein
VRRCGRKNGDTGFQRPARDGGIRSRTHAIREEQRSRNNEFARARGGRGSCHDGSAGTTSANIPSEYFLDRIPLHLGSGSVSYMHESCRQDGKALRTDPGIIVFRSLMFNRSALFT